MSSLEVFSFFTWDKTLLIAPPAAIRKGALSPIRSEHEVRQRLLGAISDSSAINRLRYYLARWLTIPNSISNMTDRMVVDQVADAVGRGTLVAYVISNYVPKMHFLALPINEGPVLRQGGPWDPRWGTAAYQREIEEQAYYASRPLEALNRSALEYQQTDAVRIISNMPGGPRGQAPPSSNKPQQNTRAYSDRPPAPRSEPKFPDPPSGFIPAPSENFRPVINPEPAKKPEPPKGSPLSKAPQGRDAEAARGMKQAQLDYNKRQGNTFEEHAMAFIRHKAKQRWGDLFQEQEYLSGYFGKNVIPDGIVFNRNGEVDIIYDAKAGSITLKQAKVYIDYLQWRGPNSRGKLIFLIPEGDKPNISKGLLDYLENKPVDIKFIPIPGWSADYPLKSNK